MGPKCVTRSHNWGSLDILTKFSDLTFFHNFLKVLRIACSQKRLINFHDLDLPVNDFFRQKRPV
jgi:hypothetical protein